jgi:hypothetical protein
MYYVIEWYVIKKNYVNNYVGGLEVFTSKKALNEYKKTIDSQTFLYIHVVNGQKLHKLIEIVNETAKTSKVGFFEILDIQYH